MQVIGFNFTKIKVERNPGQLQPSTINTNIEFIDMTQENISLLKDQDALRVVFRFSVIYNESSQKKEVKQGEALFEGINMIATPRGQGKELVKGWKKKDLASDFQLPLFNLILRKCTPKALDLEDQVGLPTHIPLPHLSPKNEGDAK